MVSLNKIVYTLGTCAIDDVHISARELVNYLGDEENILRRTLSFLNKYPQMFKKKRLGHKCYYALSPKGKEYFDRIVDMYDPVLDKVIYRE